MIPGPPSGRGPAAQSDSNSQTHPLVERVLPDLDSTTRPPLGWETTVRRGRQRSHFRKEVMVL